jgi:hypothetical protein
MFNKSKQIISSILPIFIATLWIGFSEFFRNEVIFKNFWIEHYASLGLEFETLPINGGLWLLWSFGLAVMIYVLLQKFDSRQTFLLVWLSGFVLMWITLFNLQVLPLGLLLVAVPLSILEVIVGIWIIQKLSKR